MDIYEYRCLSESIGINPLELFSLKEYSLRNFEMFHPEFAGSKKETRQLDDNVPNDENANSEFNMIK